MIQKVFTSNSPLLRLCRLEGALVNWNKSRDRAWIIGMTRGENLWALEPEIVTSRFPEFPIAFAFYCYCDPNKTPHMISIGIELKKWRTWCGETSQSEAAEYHTCLRVHITNIVVRAFIAGGPGIDAPGDKNIVGRAWSISPDGHCSIAFSTIDKSHIELLPMPCLDSYKNITEMNNERIFTRWRGCRLSKGSQRSRYSTTSQLGREGPMALHVLNLSYLYFSPGKFPGCKSVSPDVSPLLPKSSKYTIEPYSASGSYHSQT